MIERINVNFKYYKKDLLLFLKRLHIVSYRFIDYKIFKHILLYVVCS